MITSESMLHIFSFFSESCFQTHPGLRHAIKWFKQTTKMDDDFLVVFVIVAVCVAVAAIVGIGILLLGSPRASEIQPSKREKPTTCLIVAGSGRGLIMLLIVLPLSYYQVASFRQLYNPMFKPMVLFSCQTIGLLYVSRVSKYFIDQILDIYRAV